MDKPPTTDPQFEYSMKGFDIAREIAELDAACQEAEMPEEDYEQQLDAFAQRTLAYLMEGLKKFPHDFNLEIEAEGFARSLSGKRKVDFAVRFNELLYASISDRGRPVDAISNKVQLQRALDLTSVAVRINNRGFYEQTDRARELGDAVVGRVVQTALSFNQDPRYLRIPDHR